VRFRPRAVYCSQPAGAVIVALPDRG